jgi:hypothetical protein
MADSLIATTLGAQPIETFDNPAYRPPPLPGVALERTGDGTHHRSG